MSEEDKAKPALSSELEKGYANVGISTWRVVGIVLVFTATLVPYLIFTFFNGIGDLVYFISVWTIFFVIRSWFIMYSVVASITCGILLACPASTYLHIGEGTVAFNVSEYIYSFKNIEDIVIRLIFFILLMLMLHFLLKPKVKLPISYGQ